MDQLTVLPAMLQIQALVVERVHVILLFMIQIVQTVLHVLIVRVTAILVRMEVLVLYVRLGLSLGLVIIRVLPVVMAMSTQQLGLLGVSPVIKPVVLVLEEITMIAQGVLIQMLVLLRVYVLVIMDIIIPILRLMLLVVIVFLIARCVPMEVLVMSVIVHIAYIKVEIVVLLIVIMGIIRILLGFGNVRLAIVLVQIVKGQIAMTVRLVALVIPLW
mmetsp:Transcript_16904/g.2772  ORF Transcript_16904/g.2772 Transcript_16904/m.2772 type:complete len:216 (-) Transcript_16904:147-794(-)